jgi:hypothetical protein
MADESTTKTNEAGTNHGGGVISRDAAYRKTAAHFQEALDVWVELLNSRNDAIRLGAANKIIDKCLPDVKSVEITGENGGPIKLNLITGADYLSAVGKLIATPEASSTYGPAEVQSTNLASESPQDNNSNQSVSEVEST